MNSETQILSTIPEEEERKETKKNVMFDKTLVLLDKTQVLADFSSSSDSETESEDQRDSKKKTSKQKRSELTKKFASAFSDGSDTESEGGLLDLGFKEKKYQNTKKNKLSNMFLLKSQKKWKTEVTEFFWFIQSWYLGLIKKEQNLFNRISSVLS